MSIARVWLWSSCGYPSSVCIHTHFAVRTRTCVEFFPSFCRLFRPSLGTPNSWVCSDTAVQALEALRSLPNGYSNSAVLPARCACDRIFVMLSIVEEAVTLHPSGQRKFVLFFFIALYANMEPWCVP